MLTSDLQFQVNKNETGIQAEAPGKLEVPGDQPGGGPHRGVLLPAAGAGDERQGEDQGRAVPSGQGPEAPGDPHVQAGRQELRGPSGGVA